MTTFNTAEKMHFKFQRSQDDVNSVKMSNLNPVGLRLTVEPHVYPLNTQNLQKA